MHASVGDHIEILSGSLDQSPRKGVVREVIGDLGDEHYLVDWNDGHQSILFPGPDANVIP
ncbi:MAG TPA: DUF1918 domain-containing protein, partial [Actinopolymorphaceae bacterium]|nr:DUF1918 domain-containing protein [Actinopolymorphaceae bacterium]